MFLVFLLNSICFLYPFSYSLSSSLSISIIYEQDLKKDSIATYHSLINQAELFITKLDHKSAIKFYLEAFKYLKKPFEKDIYNAVLCGIYSENLSLATELSKYLVQMGCELEFFNRKPFDRMKVERKRWKKFVKDFPRNRELYNENINFELNDKIAKLHQIDQENYRNRDIYGIVLPASQDSVMNEVVRIIKEIGYPNNWNTGLNIRSTQSIDILGNIWVLVLHIYQSSPLLANEISPILKNEVLKGRLLPSIYSEWEDYRQSRPVYGSKIIFATPTGYFMENLDAQAIEKYNCKRIEINDNPYEDALAKLIYMLKFPENDFLFNLRPITIPINLSTSAFKKISINDR